MSQHEVLIVDDEASVLDALAQGLQLEGWRCETFERPVALLAKLSRNFTGVVLSDLNMPDMDGLSLLQAVKSIDADIPVILLTGYGDVSIAVQAMQLGAYSFIEKPVNHAELLKVLAQAQEQRRLCLQNRLLSEQLKQSRHGRLQLIGDSPAINQMRSMLDLMLDAPADVLIEGETGSGKELVARYLHDNSARSDHNFVAINCGAIPEQLIESELFGTEACAYTGADKKRIGKFEFANGGTLFLDEIESTPLSVQVRLLRVLEERKVTPLGANHSIALNIRVIAASKTDLEQLSQQGSFRLDLYYRLNLLKVAIAPLRQRLSDIPLLFKHFAIIAASRYHKPYVPLDQPALAILQAHSWPGNVRELRNLAERYVLLGAEAAFIQQGLSLPDTVGSAMGLAERVAFFEQMLIEDALSATKGSIKHTMTALNLPRKTLYDKMRKYGLNRDNFTDDDLSD
ncbi:two-component system, NtrC family, C4-dicarboxylate transport response regulator DctD [Rheinheimera pacifica]|uniref:Two-component system, NtrC family, C4-dicarboxylate transport response regulator DctD n=1 Tax=Rheinheimera pacifica TaxID=173990 RepID=A0A1H6LTJ0_9GAMM|nr:sigma-54 dependent transcriptional regulator [Rheinheimera pacifica]SEH88348.1 two-component system, NtrC family, C4-dicarboxylate transport response regulator DctD [Rheinheimera pacifica]